MHEGITERPPVLRGFKEVRVSKEKILDKIKANREDHRRIFEEALDGWKRQVSKDLEEAAADAKAGRAFRIRFNLPKPEDHTDDYDSVIALLEMSEDEEFELDYREFENFVLDKWGWQATFLSMSAGYGSTTASLKGQELNIPTD